MVKILFFQTKERGKRSLHGDWSLEPLGLIQVSEGCRDWQSTDKPLGYDASRPRVNSPLLSPHLTLHIIRFPWKFDGIQYHFREGDGDIVRARCLVQEQHANHWANANVSLNRTSGCVKFSALWAATIHALGLYSPLLHNGHQVHV